MAYKIKNKKKELRRKESILRVGYMELDNEAYKKFGSKFSELSEKEQRKISKKIAQEF